jgi:ribosomal protein S27AE
VIIRRRTCFRCGLIWTEAADVTDEAEEDADELIGLAPEPDLERWARVCPRCGKTVYEKLADERR